MASFSLCVSIILLQFLIQISTTTKTPKVFLFSDKTPYHFSRKTNPNPPNCEPVHISMVVRHGSRYPGRLQVNKMKALLRKINKHYPANSTFRYKGLTLPWSLPYDVLNAESKEMSKLGSEEMFSIAKRFLAAFPGVLKHGYSNSNYSFIATNKLRSSQSAVAFAQGLFQGNGHLGSWKYQPIGIKSSGDYNNDYTLRIFESCPKWQRVMKKSRTQSEHEKFKKGTEMRKVIRNISSRLKLRKKLNIQPKMIMDMFLMCAFGVQTDSADGSWCEVFEKEDLKILEYLQDLRLYWDRSYGRAVNYKMGCALYKEIIDSFQKFMHSGIPHGKFRFAHTGTVIPLLTMLGLYNDSLPPRADNFLKQDNRSFRISNVVPMGANVAFVLYSCSGKSKNGSRSSGSCKGQCQTKKHFIASDLKIQTLVNEVAVRLPACRGSTYCGLQQFLSYYSHIKDNCDIRKICRTKLKCKKWYNKRGPRD